MWRYIYGIWHSIAYKKVGFILEITTPASTHKNIKDENFKNAF